jgi:hypothetical protein
VPDGAARAVEGICYLDGRLRHLSGLLRRARQLGDSDTALIVQADISATLDERRAMMADRDGSRATVG